MKTLILLVVAANMGRPLPAQSVELQRQLVAARDTIWHAWFTNDTSVLRRYLPPAAASVEGSANVRWSDRRQIVDESREFVRSKARLVAITFSNTQIAPTGQSALVRSDYQTVVERGGRLDTTRGRATELFVWQTGVWTNPYWQLEPGSSPSKGAREILLPDSLGAAFAIGDSAAKMGTSADYDALLGTWEFRFQNRRSDGSFDTPFTGHWTFEKKPGDGLIEDRWRPDDPTIPMGISLYTYRTFDSERKVWQMIGSSSYGGEVQPGLTWSDGKNRYAIQRAYGALTRIRYLSIDADHFLWRSDRSTDGGTTWLLDSGTMEARRIGK
ncbi:MAG TPA: nuclear transport factor 2 family protein [Gemmatimonadaceae bacterium]|nr:nuclear transport factor 2 family protein [Gemmatimonadaceae bacterium]